MCPVMGKFEAQDLEKLDLNNEERHSVPSMNEGLLSDWELSRSRPRYHLRRAVIIFILMLTGLLALHGTRRSIAPSTTGIRDELRPAVDSRGSLLGAKTQKAVVLASYEGQDTTWINDVPEDWTIHKYMLPGREHHTYLHHIISNYYSLPAYTIFIHGHNTSWHQIAPITWKLRTLNLTALSERDFINLRCTHDSGCTRNTLLGAAHQKVEVDGLAQMLGSGNMTGRFWEGMLTPFGFGPYPDEIGGACCAQFAVTREAIRSQPLNFWKAYAEPLRRPMEEMQERFGMEWREKQGGALYEYLWHIVFGRPAVDCPAEDVCRGTFFRGEVECERYPGRFQTSKGWRDIKCSSPRERDGTTELEKPIGANALSNAR